MKILIIGATGTIGSAIVEALGQRHDIITAGRSRADFEVDLGDRDSIRAMFEAIGEVDAVVSAAGQARFGTLDQLEDEDYALGFGSKLMGQINLVRFGRAHVREGGSFTLTSGILADRPHPGSTSISAVNAGLEGFARSAALQLTSGQRINVVSPPMVRETAIKLGWGNGGMSARQVASAYVMSIEGDANGQILKPHEL